MTINMVQIGSWFGSLVALWAAVKLKYKEWQPVIQPMIEEAENDAKDGVIDAADRKHIVMIGIAAAEKDGKIKLNWITRLIISKAVDYFAKKLPDFIIPVNNETSKPTQ